MDDADFLHHISQLTDEEHHLERSGTGLSDEQAERLRNLEVALDHSWDLLRYRRAEDDPGEATVRPETVVERYQQQSSFGTRRRTGRRAGVRARADAVT